MKYVYIYIFIYISTPFSKLTWQLCHESMSRMMEDYFPPQIGYSRPCSPGWKLFHKWLINSMYIYITCTYIILSKNGRYPTIAFFIVQHNYHPHLYGIYIYIYEYIYIHIMLHVTCLPKLSTSFQVHLGQRCGRVARPNFLPRISVGLVGREKPWVTQVMNSSLFT